jgi:decaprenylphospho-beta-D-erythro-pentofuranosid-2-ulose 2-reductase
MTRETWLVLGASSAIARAFALEAARHDASVVLAGRDAEDLERTAADVRIRTGQEAAVLAFDATDFASHPGFVAKCRESAGHLNVFLAFGANPPQEALEQDVARARATIDANYTGAVSVLTLLLPVLEAQGRGHVVVLGSVAGDRGRRKNYLYGSAKAGLATFTQGLRARLVGTGVTVTTVKLGFVDTAMTWGLPGLFLVASPDAVARRCWRLAARGVENAYVPGFWRLIMTILRAIPERIFKRLPI